MPQYGLLLRVTHTGKAADSVQISDIRDGVDILSSFRKAGPIYVPVPAKGGVAILVYSGDVAISFETGGIRKFIEAGYLTAEFLIGDTLGPVLFPSVEDEGIEVEPDAQVFDFVGAGVTASQTAPGHVQINVPGAGAGDHALLANLPWLVAGHTSVASPNTLAAFDGVGTATLITTTVSGDVTGALPGPLSVTDFSFPGEAQGDILYFDGANWAILPAGTPGYLLQTNGAAAPAWVTVPSPGTFDHAALTSNLVWGTSGHTGNANTAAGFDGAGAATYLDVLLADGSVAGATGSAQDFGSNGITADNIEESTGNNGVVVNGVRNYGKLAADPAVGPAPADGDIYYNTALRMPMMYDGLRSKWLSIESAEFHFGRDGNTKEDQFYRAADGRVMSATLGWYAIRSGTVLSLGYTRSDSGAATFDIVKGGVFMHSVPSSATKGRDIAINSDFAFGDVLAVLNRVGGLTTSNVIGWIRVKWRA